MAKFFDDIEIGSFLIADASLSTLILSGSTSSIVLTTDGTHKINAVNGHIRMFEADGDLTSHSMIERNGGNFHIHQNIGGTYSLAMRINAAGDSITFDPNSLGYDVGIKTASPSEALHVVGNILSAGSIFSSGDTEDINISVTNPSSGAFVGGFTLDSSWTRMSGLRFRDNGIGSLGDVNREWLIGRTYNGGNSTPELKISYSGDNGSTFAEHMIIATGGNVGIGVTPTQKLQVNGNTLITGDLIVDTNTLFVDASTDNVGIGISSPTEKLHINAANLGDISNNVPGGASDEKVYLGVDTASQSVSYNLGVNDGARGTRAKFFLSDGTVDSPTGQQAWGLWETWNSGGQGPFVIGINTEKFRINTNGNVGIATQTPTEKLHVVGNTLVSGNSTISTNLIVTGTSTLTDDLIVDTDTLFVDASTDRVGVGRVPTSVFDVLDSNGSTFDFDGGFSTGAIARVVGLTNSIVRFIVSDNTTGMSLGIRGSAENTAGGPGFGQPNTAFIIAGSDTNGLNIIVSPGATANDIRFYAGLNADEGTAHIHIHGSNLTGSIGDVGFGTENPTEKLHVIGNTLVSGNSTITGDLTVDTNTLIVDSSTNQVGIGRTSPEVNLHIGDASFSGMSVSTNVPGGASDELVFVGSSTGTSSVSYNLGIADGEGRNKRAKFFLTDGTGFADPNGERAWGLWHQYGSGSCPFVIGIINELFRINPNGNVGVGMNAPTAAISASQSTVTRASIRMYSGTAPTSPNAGDMWFDGTNFKGWNGSSAVTLG